MNAVTVGVVGATGAVGKEIVDCLNKSSLDVSKLRIFGSERSAGTCRDAGKFGQITVEPFDVTSARECDVVFLAVSGDFALEHAKAISEGEDGAVVIDNSSAFRYDKDVPLVVPEINGECTKGAKLIANPNCTTAIGLMALWPLHKLFKVKRVIMSVSVTFGWYGRLFTFAALVLLVKNLMKCSLFRLTKPHQEQDNLEWMSFRRVHVLSSVENAR
jgi:aspartate-semialdehyde dehydrogenase